MPQLKFILNPSYDWEVFRSFRKGQGFKLHKEIKTREDFLAVYRKLRPFLTGSRAVYQAAWDEINDFFFRYVERLTKHPWKFKKYYCVLSPFHKGVSNWGENRIIRSWAENPYTQRKITAHELLITHLWDYLDRHGYKNLSDESKWAFCEITAWAIAGLEEKLIKKCWPWIAESERWPLRHNYPQLVGLQKKIRPLYERRSSFKSYTEKALRVIS